jgi:hypothetical protein
MSDVRCQRSEVRGQRSEVGGRGHYLKRKAGDYASLHRHRCRKIPGLSNWGCRGIISLPGCLRGSAPQGFDFYTPLRGHKGGAQKIPLRSLSRGKQSSQGRSGGKGAAPPATAQRRRLWHQSSPTRRRSRHLSGLRSDVRRQMSGNREVTVGFAAAGKLGVRGWFNSRPRRGIVNHPDLRLPQP